jgi:hypothetical protein
MKQTYEDEATYMQAEIESMWEDAMHDKIMMQYTARELHKLGVSTFTIPETSQKVQISANPNDTEEEDVYRIDVPEYFERVEHVNSFAQTNKELLKKNVGYMKENGELKAELFQAKHELEVLKARLFKEEDPNPEEDLSPEEDGGPAARGPPRGHPST